MVEKGTKKEGKEKKGRRRQTTNKKLRTVEKDPILFVNVQECFSCVLLF